MQHLSTTGQHIYITSSSSGAWGGRRVKAGGEDAEGLGAAGGRGKGGGKEGRKKKKTK